MGSQLITATGNTNWNWPAGVTSVTVELLGGGGGGGTATGNPSRGGGGKGGGYSKKVITKGVESLLAIAVGTGGTASGNGAISTTTQNGSVVQTATGGAGAASTATATGAGATTNVGTASGDTTYAGGNGATGTSGGISGAGGGAAGPTSAGGNASTGTGGTRGTGTWGDGSTTRNTAGANGVNASAAGTAGAVYGAGGSGGAAGNNTDRAGGGGAQGVALLTWTDPPAFAGDQTAFRFYEDGSEAGSTATAAQDTNIPRDLSGGDSNLALRVRIQETGGGVGGDSPDDYQLDVLKSGTGGYYPLNGKFTEYALANASTATIIRGGSLDSAGAAGTSIVGAGLKIGSVKVRLSKTASPVDNVFINIYSNAGGSSHGTAFPGSVIATSGVINGSAITGTQADYTFTFTGADSITLANGTYYFIIIDRSGGYDATNYYRAGIDATSSTYAGDLHYLDFGSWNSDGAVDLVFEAYGVSPAAPFASTNTTDGGATTNRLGSGSGSFVAGKVSEDGEVDNLAVTAGNYTELLYPITLVAAQLANADTLDFKVYRNGAALDAYTVTPRITISTGGGGGTVVRILGLLGVG